MMPITCPKCGSTNVVVYCRLRASFSVVGELCGEQRWDLLATNNETREPVGAGCLDCLEPLGIVMLGDMLAGLTSEEHDETCGNCGGQGCLACLKPKQPWDATPESRHVENNRVNQVGLVAELTGTKPVRDGDRVTVSTRGGELVACCYDAYEYWRVKKPELGLPELDEPVLYAQSIHPLTGAVGAFAVSKGQHNGSAGVAA